MKKIISLALAFILIMSLGASAFAEDLDVSSNSDSPVEVKGDVNGNVTLTDTEGKTVNVSGDVSGNITLQINNDSIDGTNTDNTIEVGGKVGGDVSLKNGSDKNIITVDGDAGGVRLSGTGWNLYNPGITENVITVGGNVSNTVFLFEASNNKIKVGGDVGEGVGEVVTVVYGCNNNVVIVEGEVKGIINDGCLSTTIYVGETTSLSGVDGFLVGLKDKADKNI